MKAKKTRKELERELQGDKRLFLLILILVIILAIFLVIYSSGKDKLKEQLSECQEQVLVWTLKFVCYEEDIKITLEQNYTDYEEYNWALELIGDSDYKLFENCEVLK